MSLKNGILGNAIRTSRIENMLTQEELAELVGITPTHLKHLESEHRKPSIEVLFKLVDILHFSLDSLLISEPKPSEKTDYIDEINLLLPQCSERELKALKSGLKELCRNK